ncbi:abortive infection family protein [Sulfobacillus thermosulfidooxidans]|uniref:abortive infection family protein n=1 Tax=Sulfobacillus thermosulfidooxidans TaxID=28034 RepID=UPI000313895E|nr:abortive infection family protein [Sulfobacillus thermosulfidooxidans]
MAISESTRIEIFHKLIANAISWSGRFNDVEFLKRLYPLSDLPSTDYRFQNAAGDIHQHRVNFTDWEDDWILHDPRFGLYFNDDKFLKFLAETVHPAVRPDVEQAKSLVAMYNSYLSKDGWELVPTGDISGRLIYEARRLETIPIALQPIEQTVIAGDFKYLDQQVKRMKEAIDKDPDLAIGTAKELIETVCKTILQELHHETQKDWSLGRLFKETYRTLDGSSGDNPSPNSISQILGGLNTVVSGISELRNNFGTGHGRPADASSLDSHVAKLAVGAASVVASYLFETYNRLYK